MLCNKNWRHCLKNISENIREKSFTFQWGVSQWMKHLRILHTAARASALCLAAPHCPCAEGHACQEQHWHGHMHGPLAERCGVLSSPLTAGKGRITPLPEELLHMLGARFQGNQLQSHKFPFLSSPTTDWLQMLSSSAEHPLSGSWVWIHTGIVTASPTTSKSSECMSTALLNLAHGRESCLVHQGHLKR